MRQTPEATATKKQKEIDKKTSGLVSMSNVLIFLNAGRLGADSAQEKASSMGTSRRTFFTSKL
jgi:hypothetical protein